MEEQNKNVASTTTSPEQTGTPVQTVQSQPQINPQPMKYCSHCGGQIPEKAVVCTLCGCQVSSFENTNNAQPNIIINNANSNAVNNSVKAAYAGKVKNKWVAVALCIFLGVFGGHKFYEGKILFGIIYLFTGGLLGFGVLIDLIILLLKPNPYTV